MMNEIERFDAEMKADVEEALTNLHLLDLFEEFCEQQYCAENIRFWKQLQNYKADVRNMIAMVGDSEAIQASNTRKSCTECLRRHLSGMKVSFFEVMAPDELNVDDEVRNQILSRLDRCLSEELDQLQQAGLTSRDLLRFLKLFDAAEYSVRELIVNHSFQGFQHTQSYKNFKANSSKHTVMKRLAFMPSFYIEKQPSKEELDADILSTSAPSSHTATSTAPFTFVKAKPKSSRKSLAVEKPTPNPDASKQSPRHLSVMIDPRNRSTSFSELFGLVGGKDKKDKSSLGTTLPIENQESDSLLNLLQCGGPAFEFNAKHAEKMEQLQLKLKELEVEKQRLTNYVRDIFTVFAQERDKWKTERGSLVSMLQGAGVEYTGQSSINDADIDVLVSKAIDRMNQQPEPRRVEIGYERKCPPRPTSFAGLDLSTTTTVEEEDDECDEADDDMNASFSSEPNSIILARDPTSVTDVRKLLARVSARQSVQFSSRPLNFLNDGTLTHSVMSCGSEPQLTTTSRIVTSTSTASTLTTTEPEPSRVQNSADRMPSSPSTPSSSSSSLRNLDDGVATAIFELETSTPTSGSAIANENDR